MSVKEYMGLGAVLALSVLTGCVHATVEQGVVSDVKGPYRQILVCSLSNNLKRAEETEAALALRLETHHIKVDTCTRVLPPRNQIELSSGIARIRASGFDAVLLIKSSDPSKNESLVTESKSSTLAGFLDEYKRRAQMDDAAQAVLPGLVETGAFGGQERRISGSVKLISVAEDRTIWANSGTVTGPASRPIAEFIQTVIERTENELTDVHLIPKR